LDAIIEKCLAKEAAARYASTGDLLIDLRDVAILTAAAKPPLSVTDR